MSFFFEDGRLGGGWGGGVSSGEMYFSFVGVYGAWVSEYLR